jgi:hypothetical protein
VRSLPVGRSPRWWPAPGRRRRAAAAVRGEAGVVTAETAIVSMGLVIIAVAMLFVVAVGIAQVRCVDASRDVARALARGESEAHSVDLGRLTAPAGAQFSTSTAGGVVRVDVSATVTGPGVLRRFGGVQVRSTSAVASEPGVGPSAGLGQ